MDVVSNSFIKYDHRLFIFVAVEIKKKNKFITIYETKTS